MRTHNNQHGAVLFVKKMFLFSIASWVGAVLSFIVTPIVTRTFETDELGKVSMFIMFATLLEYLAIMGLNQGFARFFHEPPEGLNKKKLFKVCISMTWGFSAILSAVIMFFGKWISIQICGEYDLLVPICLCVYIVAKGYLLISNVENRMNQNVKRYTIQSLAMNIAIKISYAFAALGGATYRKAILYITATTLILFIVYFILQRDMMKNDLKGVKKKSLIPILKYSIPLTPVAFMSYFNASLPKLVLQNYADFSAVGIYTAATTLVGIISLIQAGFNIFWTPYVYENYKINQPSIRKVHNFISIAMVGMGLLIMLFQDVIYMLLGESYRASYPYFAIMLTSPILYTIAETTGLGINISKKTALNIITYTITIFINVVVSILLVPTMKIGGAAIATMIASWAMFISKTIMGERYYKVIESKLLTFTAPTVFTVATIGSYLLSGMQVYRLLFIGVCSVALCIIYRRILTEMITIVINIVLDFIHKIKKWRKIRPQ